MLCLTSRKHETVCGGAFFLIFLCASTFWLYASYSSALDGELLNLGRREVDNAPLLRKLRDPNAI